MYVLFLISNGNSNLLTNTALPEMYCPFSNSDDINGTCSILAFGTGTLNDGFAAKKCSQFSHSAAEEVVDPMASRKLIANPTHAKHTPDLFLSQK